MYSTFLILANSPASETPHETPEDMGNFLTSLLPSLMSAETMVSSGERFWYMVGMSAMQNTLRDKITGWQWCYNH